MTRRGSTTTFDVGGDLLSPTLASAGPSALEGLASGFGMGPGVPHSATTTDNHINFSLSRSPTEHTTPPPPTPTRKSRKRGWTWLCAQGHTVDANNKRYVLWASPRPISTGRLHPSQGFHPRPINPIVSRGPYPRKVVGDLILERASRLDAFSGYPFRT